jgi:hypothetical protein
MMDRNSNHPECDRGDGARRQFDVGGARIERGNVMGLDSRPEKAAEASIGRRDVMGFDRVLDHLRGGSSARRFGWNGSNLRVSMVLGIDPSNPAERASHLDGIPSRLYAHGSPGMVRRYPHFVITNGSNNNATGVWVPSTTDLLAQDWEIL